MGKQPEHICRFNRTNKTLEILFPKNLRFGTLRRKFREFLLISEENCRRQCTPKGTAGYMFEKEKHLTQHYYMIHPYSKFRQVWEMAAIIEIMLALTIRMFLISQLRDVVLHSASYQTYALFSDMFEMIDATVLTLLTGYLDPDSHTVGLETHKVFVYNLKHIGFYLNVIASLPLDFIVYAFSIDTQVYPILKFCVFFKILKLHIIHRYLTHIKRIYRLSELVSCTIWISVAMFILCHSFTCLFYVLLFGSEFGKPNNKFDKIHNCFFRHFSMFYLITTVFFFQNGISDNVVITSTKDIIFFIVLLLTVNLTNIVFLGLFVQVLGLQNTSYIHYREMIQEVQKFLIQENLPKHIHRKVVKYFEYRFRYRYFREKMILDTLSLPLRREIANFICLNYVLGETSIFKDLPLELASALCLKLKFEMFLTGDVLTRAGKDAKKMFFIYCGTIALYSQRGKEILHMYPGQHVGISTFAVPHHQYAVTSIALETSECYVLSYHDFLACISDYPQYRDVITRAANDRRVFLLKYTTRTR